MLHNATVTFDPGVTSASALVEAVRRTGYGAEIPAEHASILAEQAEHDEEQLREYKQLRLKAGISVEAGCFAMIMSMPIKLADSYAQFAHVNLCQNGIVR